MMNRLLHWEHKLKEELPHAPVALPNMIWQYLYVQGIRTEKEIQQVFSPTLRDLTHPFKLLNMDCLVERLVQALHKNEKICIYGDFDLDGTSGVALLLQGMSQLGFQNLTYYQPKRISEGYGVHVAAIEKLKEEGVNVILTVDVGITDVKAAKKAKELGMDFIITDHHMPKEELPEAFTIVNPNQKGCSSGLGFLCGAGVGFYVILALKLELEKKQKIDFNPKELLDLFAIATITDMVPLVRENRVLIKHGLSQLQKTKNMGLKLLLESLNLLQKKELTSVDVAFRLAPKLNALSRLEMGVLPIDLYLAQDQKSAQKLIKKMLQINERRVSLQKNSEIEAEKFVLKYGLGDFILVCSSQFHKGIVGLVATKMTQKFGVPAFIGAINSEGEITGSSRRPSESQQSLLKALEFSQKALVRFGGHDPAAGFLLKSDQEEHFRTLLKEYFEREKQQDCTVQETCISFDAQGLLKEIDESFMNWYEQLGPFGSHFEPPIFRANDLVVEKVQPLKGGHIKLSLLEEQSGKKMQGLWFSPPQGHPFEGSFENFLRVNILFAPQWNYFNGRKLIQILIKDLRVEVEGV